MNPSTRRRRAFVDLLVAVEELREARLAEEAAERFGLDLSMLPEQPSGESHDAAGRVIGRYHVTTDAAVDRIERKLAAVRAAHEAEPRHDTWDRLLCLEHVRSELARRVR